MLTEAWVLGRGERTGYFRTLAPACLEEKCLERAAVGLASRAGARHGGPARRRDVQPPRAGALSATTRTGIEMATAGTPLFRTRTRARSTRCSLALRTRRTSAGPARVASQDRC